MQKTLIGLGILVAVLILGFFALNSYIYDEKQAVAGKDAKNAEYIIAGQRIQLVDGVYEAEVAPGSASKVITKYFGNGLVTDLNADGKDDQVFLITQDTGGSGTFYYVVAALQTDRGYVGSEALLLGDRISPQQTRLEDDGNISVAFADRKPGEHFGVPTSVGKSLVLKFDPDSMQFGEVVQNFEGEADPSAMTLDMKKWEWVSASLGDGRTLTPKKPGVFVVVFEKDNRFSASTDCNSVGGEYLVQGSVITFDKMMSTLMFCEDSQEAEFAKLLTDATGFSFTAKSELILNLKLNSGTATFK